MTRAEALQTAKPILFNTDMVRAILGGKKTVTRRIVKNNPCECASKVVNGICKLCDDKGGFFLPDEYVKVHSPHQIGDILYVRETFAPLYETETSTEIVGYMYKAETMSEYDNRIPVEFEWWYNGKWKPSIHMPKEAARIFLRVTDVRAERLQDIRYEGCLAEGVRLTFLQERDLAKRGLIAQNRFSGIWNSTVKKSDINQYGWDANPWVWVIEFKKISIKEQSK